MFIYRKWKLKYDSDSGKFTVCSTGRRFFLIKTGRLNFFIRDTHIHVRELELHTSRLYAFFV